MCRERSLYVDPQARKALSLAIHRTRKQAKQDWRRTLHFRAACGDWAARRLLARKGASSRVAARPLLEACGSKAAAVDHVKQHFDRRFQDPGDPLVTFAGLTDTEPDFSAAEVIEAVGKLKLGKTTGISKVSVELLRQLVSAAFGLDILTFMLNSLLRDPDSAHCALGTGWMVLLPKTVWIDHASGFRPIVWGKFSPNLQRD